MGKKPIIEETVLCFRERGKMKGFCGSPLLSLIKLANCANNTNSKREQTWRVGVSVSKKKKEYPQESTSTDKREEQGMEDVKQNS